MVLASINSIKCSSPPKKTQLDHENGGFHLSQQGCILVYNIGPPNSHGLRGQDSRGPAKTPELYNFLQLHFRSWRNFPQPETRSSETALAEDGRSRRFVLKEIRRVGRLGCFDRWKVGMFMVMGSMG